MKKLFSVAVGFAIIVGAVGCTSVAAEDQKTAPTASAEISETPLGETSQWVIDQLNQSTPIEVEEWEQRVSPVLTKDIELSELISVLNKDIQPAAPLTVVSYSENAGTSIITLSDTSQGEVIMNLTLDNDSLISGIYFN